MVHVHQGKITWLRPYTCMKLPMGSERKGDMDWVGADVWPAARFLASIVKQVESS